MSAPNSLSLLGRHWHTPSLDRAGWREESLSFPPSEVGLVAMHLWNVGDAGGPPIPDQYFLDMGMRKTQEESLRVAEGCIRPAIHAARRAGVAVLHVEPEKIACKYPQYSPAAAPPSPSPQSPPEPNPGWRKERLNRSHGRDYAEWEGWEQMRIIGCCEAEKDDPVVATTEQLDRVCRERGIKVLVYTGFAANMCVLDAGGGARHMGNLGYRVYLVREATLAVEYPDTFDDRTMTRAAIRFFQQVVGDTLGLDQFVEGCNRCSGV